MVSASDFTQCDQIVWVQLQIRVEVKRSDMMDLYSLARVATAHTGWLAQEMLLFDPGPIGAAFPPIAPGYARSMVHSPGRMPSWVWAVPSSPPGPGRPIAATSANDSPEQQQQEQSNQQHYP
jgi:hypothetical protein